jgi:oligopeptide/dipeptide ABC transporter ATP-binding protein
MADAPLLSVERLDVTMRGVPVLEDVSFQIAPGETLGLVGESGCGKSVTALSIMRLLPNPPGKIAGGRILFDGIDMTALDAAGLRAIRGDRIGMIFQEPMTSLNPVYTIGDQIGESLIVHRGMSGSAAKAETAKLLDLVGIPSARNQLGRYPHEMSGGQRQRVMIAIALACRPKLLIADEPTTALDVTVQAQILDLIGRLRVELGMAVLLITHDLGVVAEFCDRVAVMYAGRIVEEAPAAELFRRPRHRYTEALLHTMPAANPPGRKLPSISGTVPAPLDRGDGCIFAPRCGFAVARCTSELPSLEGAPHRLRCWNPA